MAFQILRSDIINIHADAIVNTANPRPLVGAGTDSRIHQAAGPGLLEARQAIGPIRPGTAAVTPAFGLNARIVIHTVGPVWRGGLFGEAKVLRRCYDAALSLAAEHGCRSIAFPLICAGSYGYPKDKAMQIALGAFSEFLMDHDMDITLVVFDKDAFGLSEKLFREVSSYIDEHYVEQVQKLEYQQAPQALRERRIREADFSAACMEMPPMPRTAPARARPAIRLPSWKPEKPLSLEELLKQTDAGFSETLLKLIDQSGRKDSEIYTRANVSRQHFSKIRNNPAYRPTKATAIAFAIALELDLEQTGDLLGRAGYTLTNSSKFDVIIRYCIERGNYDLYEINAMLYQFDQSILGA